MKKIIILLILFTLSVASVIAIRLTHSDRLIRIATGATSQMLCSKTFISSQSPDNVYSQDMRPEPGMGLVDWALRYDVDRAHKQVRTTVLGLFASLSVYREGLGCMLVHDITPADAPASPTLLEAPALLPEIASPDLVSAGDPALKQAVDQAFDEPATGARRSTQAVVVVHDGTVITERYAPGYGVDTPLLSHSVAKSVINALIGILVRQGKLSITATVPFATWHSEASDPRSRVTIDELLRMDSGLPLDEGVGSSLAQRMWFVEPDSAAFAETTPLAAAPTAAWAYSNLGYAILSRIVRDAIGGSPRDIAQFAQHELFAPLGMRHAVIEFDSAGTPMGSNAMFATAREWARFGLLYLSDGVAGGERILPEGWVAYSTRQTLDTGYGAGFWLNAVDTPIPVWRGLNWGMEGAPRDAFFARGYLGQYVVVVPSEKLIVVRFGASHTPGGDINGVGALVHNVVAALHGSVVNP